MKKLEAIQDDVIEQLSKTKNKIESAKKKNQIELLEELEKERIKLRAKLKYIVDHIETTMKEIDNRLRPAKKQNNHGRLKKKIHPY